MAVTTDSASNNFSFMRLVSEYCRTKNIHHVSSSGSRVSCFAHVINLAVQDFLKAANIESNQKDNEEIDFEIDTQSEDVTEGSEAERETTNILKKVVVIA